MKFRDFQTVIEVRPQPVNIDRIAGATVIKFTECDPALLRVDAVVEEQDTHMLLGKSPVIMNSVTSFTQLVRKMEQQLAEVPGTVIVRQSSPKRFITIVYDIDSKPICREEWLELALKNIFEQCRKFEITTLAMPLIGTSYGRIDAHSMIALLEQQLLRYRPDYPRKILIYNLP